MLMEPKIGRIYDGKEFPVECPQCYSTDVRIDADGWHATCNECDEYFSIGKHLRKCECENDEFVTLLSGYYRCPYCGRIYDEYGEENKLICQRCGCEILTYLGPYKHFEQCFKCEDCGMEYESDYPELYYYR